MPRKKTKPQTRVIYLLAFAIFAAFLIFIFPDWFSEYLGERIRSQFSNGQ